MWVLWAVRLLSNEKVFTLLVDSSIHFDVPCYYILLLQWFYSSLQQVSILLEE